MSALSHRSMLYLSGAETDQSAQEAADNLREKLSQLEEERKAATTKAEAVASKSQRLAEAVQHLQNGALRAMKQGDEAAARELLQEKAVVSAALEKAKGRAAVNFSLAEKLNKLIGAKQTELIALLHQAGVRHGLATKSFSVDPAGLVSVDGDDVDSATHTGQEAPSQSQSGQARRQQSTPQHSSYRSLVQDSQDYQSEEDVDNKFLELERQTLESMMQASAMRSQQGSAQHGQDEDERRSSGAQAGTSSPAGKAAGSSTWWHSASDRLHHLKEDLGPLEAHQAQAMAKDVTTILTKMINARVMRGQDPKASQLIELAQLQAGVQASMQPGVRITPPKTDFSVNIRQRLFRDAVAAALQACSASSAGGQLQSWQDLTAKWSSQLHPAADAVDKGISGRASDKGTSSRTSVKATAGRDPEKPMLAKRLGGGAAVEFSAAKNAVLAQMFLRSMAQLLKIEQDDAERIVHAAVAAHTRARLLDSLAVVKQVEGTSKHTAALGQMQQLASVVDAFPLPEHSAEMELVYSGLRAFLVYEDRKLLYEAYSKVTSSQSSQHAVADALGMLY